MLRVVTTRAPLASLKFKLGHYPGFAGATDGTGRSERGDSNHSRPPNIKLDLARRQANACDMKWKATRLLPPKLKSMKLDWRRDVPFIITVGHKIS
jgi:hypothetical protein